MKQCPQCGYQNEDMTVFCTSCGEKLESEFAYAQNSNNNPQANFNNFYEKDSDAGFGPQYARRDPYPGGYNNYDSSPPPYPGDYASSPGMFGGIVTDATNALKEVASSTKFLVMAICYTAGLFFSFFASLTSASTFNEMFSNYNPYLYDSLNTSLSGIYVIPAMIPQILVCVGIWMIYTSARDDAVPSVKTTGLSLIKGTMIFNMIGSIIGIVIVLVISFIMIAASGSLGDYLGTPYESGIFSAVFGVLIGACIIVAAIVIPYFVGIIKTINTVKNTSLSGVPSDKVSSFVAVMNFIMLLGCLANFIYGFFGVISGVSNGAALVIASLLIFSYKDTMSRLMHSSRQPQYPPQGYY